MEPYGPVGDDDAGVVRRTLRPIYHRLPPIVQEFVDRVYDSLLPPQDEDLLLDDEEIYYKSRRHVAEVVQPLLMLLGTILVATFLFADVPVIGRALGVIGLLILVAGLIPTVLSLDRTEIVQAIRSAVPWIGGALILAFVFDLAWLPAAAVITWVAARLSVRLLRWRFFRVLYLTNRRLIQTEGFFSRRQATLPLSRVTDVALSYSSVGEYLNYATFRVESAGQTLFRQIDFLAAPEEFHRMVIFLATTPRPLDEDWPRVIDQGLVPRSVRDERRGEGR